MDRVETGQRVHDRLIAAAGVQRARIDAIDLFLLRDFVPADHRVALTALIDARRQPSPLFADQPDPAFRTSETCNLAPAEPAVRALEAALQTLTGLDPAHGERLQ